MSGRWARSCRPQGARSTIVHMYLTRSFFCCYLFPFAARSCVVNCSRAYPTCRGTAAPGRHYGLELSTLVLVGHLIVCYMPIAVRPRCLADVSSKRYIVVVLREFVLDRGHDRMIAGQHWSPESQPLRFDARLGSRCASAGAALWDRCFMDARGDHSLATKAARVPRA